MVFRSIPVIRWDTIPADNIIETYAEDIFDSADANVRVRVVLEDLPLLDESGQEIQVFNQAGYRIPRREPILEDDNDFNGMLFNLRTLHQLFMLDGLEDETLLEDLTMTEHYLYPMACLKTIGHFQAKGLMTPFLKKVKALNTRIKEQYNGDDEDTIADELLTGYSPLIEGIACQGYNLLLHHVWTQGRYHEVQQGLMTAALSGTHTSPATNANVAAKFWTDCETWLPFDRYHEKVTHTRVDTSTRIENVYRVSLWRLPERAQNGRLVHVKCQVHIIGAQWLQDDL